MADASVAASERESNDRQAFWTLIVAAPAVLSVLRLWVESGGELQTTLLLVENVDPINLIAAFIATASWLAAAGLVVIFAIGGVLLASDGPESNYFFARWTRAAPRWLIVASFLLAALTWQILYLPLLLPAWCAAFQLAWLRPGRRLRGALAAGVMLTGYAFAFWPTVQSAWHGGEVLALLLLIAPPMLALAVAGPILPRLVRPIAVVAHAGCALFLLAAVVPFITTPVLPLTVIVVTTAGSTTPEYLRGHIIAVNDVNTTILLERGGVQYIPNIRIESEVLCPSEEELPRYRLFVRGFRIEDSLLRGLGREVRPVSPLSPACRAAPDQLTTSD